MGPGVFAAQLQSGDLVELPLPMSVEWKSALLVKREPTQHRLHDTW